MLTVDRIGRITSLIDTASARGIELIGSNDQPLGAAFSGLRTVTRSGQRLAGQPADFRWKPGTRLATALGDWAPVDYVLAPAIIDEVPDVIGWLDHVAETLADEGHLCLAITDKRFSPDARRPVTSTGQLVEAHLRGLASPTAAQIFDHTALRLLNPDPVALWNGRDPRTFKRAAEDPAAEAYRLTMEQLQVPSDISLPIHVFTDQSFADILADLAATGLFPYAVAEFMPTRRYQTEFFVTLQKLGSWLTPEARRVRQEAGFALSRERLAHADRLLVGEPDEPPVLPSASAVAAYVRTEGRRVARDLAVRAEQARSRAAALRERRKK